MNLATSGAHCSITDLYVSALTRTSERPLWHPCRPTPTSMLTPHHDPPPQSCAPSLTLLRHPSFWSLIGEEDAVFKPVVVPDAIASSCMMQSPYCPHPDPCGNCRGKYHHLCLQKQQNYHYR